MTEKIADEMEEYGIFPLTISITLYGFDVSEARKFRNKIKRLLPSATLANYNFFLSESRVTDLKGNPKQCVEIRATKKQMELLLKTLFALGVETAFIFVSDESVTFREI